MLKQSENLRQQKYEDLRWARRNVNLRKQYEGQLVIVHNKQMIAHGHDEAQRLAQAASDEHRHEELVVVEMLPVDFEAEPGIV